MSSSAPTPASLQRAAVATAVLFGLVMWLGVRWCVPASTAVHLGHDMGATGVAACSMGATEHLSWWESQLTAASIGTTDGVGLLALVLLTVAVAAGTRRWVFTFDRQLQLIQRLYTRHHPEAPLYRPLSAAFADGTLHPKVPSDPGLA